MCSARLRWEANERLFLCARECVFVSCARASSIEEKEGADPMSRDTPDHRRGFVFGVMESAPGPTSHPEVTLAFFCPSDV